MKQQFIRKTCYEITLKERANLIRHSISKKSCCKSQYGSIGWRNRFLLMLLPSLRELLPPAERKPSFVQEFACFVGKQPGGEKKEFQPPMYGCALSRGSCTGGTAPRRGATARSRRRSAAGPPGP